jgi:hypothetical protein
VIGIHAYRLSEIFDSLVVGTLTRGRKIFSDFHKRLRSREISPV